DTDRAEARQLLDRVISTFPSAPRTDFARLNRAILLMRMGDATGAEAPLRDWIRRAPFPPLLGRAQAALGAALLAAGRPTEARSAPRLLYVLTAIAVDEKDWPGALATAKRLTSEFPSDEAADDALERVGTGAAAGGAWPMVIEAYGLMEKLYPKSPFLEPARV